MKEYRAVLVIDFKNPNGDKVESTTNINHLAANKAEAQKKCEEAAQKKLREKIKVLGDRYLGNTYVFFDEKELTPSDTSVK